MPAEWYIKKALAKKLAKIGFFFTGIVPVGDEKRELTLSFSHLTPTLACMLVYLPYPHNAFLMPDL
ncbi:hypothetical protein C5S30_01245 [ANME-1 cluster archaeon GoMg4]|nr:hypothetical protein [ANME-1 cluster archaeon GoMg4]